MKGAIVMAWIAVSLVVIALAVAAGGGPAKACNGPQDYEQYPWCRPTTTTAPATTTTVPATTVPATTVPDTVASSTSTSTSTSTTVPASTSTTTTVAASSVSSPAQEPTGSVAASQGEVLAAVVEHVLTTAQPSAGVLPATE